MRSHGLRNTRHFHKQNASFFRKIHRQNDRGKFQQELIHHGFNPISLSEKETHILSQVNSLCQSFDLPELGIHFCVEPLSGKTCLLLGFSNRRKAGFSWEVMEVFRTELSRRIEPLGFASKINSFSWKDFLVFSTVRPLPLVPEKQLNLTTQEPVISEHPFPISAQNTTGFKESVKALWNKIFGTHTG